MIKNIFIPERLREYYLFPKRIIGFDLGRSQIHATQVYLYRRSIIIEKFIEEKLENNINIAYPERVAQAIKAIMARADQCHEIHSALSSSVVVFKELKVPFLEHEKIRNILHFEVEPLLPFPLSSAVTDFIITKQDTAEKSSEILIAAVQKEQVAQHLQLFAAAGIDPAVITVDLFALYGLYSHIPEYESETGNIALIDLGIQSTRIGFISNKQLKYIRALPKGLLTVAKQVSDEMGTSVSETMEAIIRFGLESHDNQKLANALTRVLTSFWSEIDFTVRSFAQQTNQQAVSSLLLLGPGSEIKDVCPFVSTLVSIPCKLFTISSMLRNGHVKLANSAHVPRTHAVSLATALPSSIMAHFNLRRDEFAVADMNLFKKQLIVGSSLLVILFISMIIFMFWQLRSLRLEYNSSEEEAVAALKARFPNAQGTGLESVANSADTQLKSEEQALGFLSPARPSYLSYLLELTTHIEKRDPVTGQNPLGFEIDKLVIENDVMTLEARVRDYDALKKFEKGLHASKMFEFSPINKPEFTLKIRLKGS